MKKYFSHCADDTEKLGIEFGKKINQGTVIALFGGMGMGKTVFVRGLAKGMGLKSDVSSPTFALIHDYGGNPPLYHFDMYRVSSWEDLYSTGFFDYIDAGGVLAVEWSENIENALPEHTIRIRFETGCNENERMITIENEDER